MATNTYKILGQVNPTANTQSNVYVVPAATEAVINSIQIANQSTSNVSYSLIMMPSGAYASPAAAANYVVRGGVVPAADSIILTIGLTANAGSIFAANTNNPNVSFSMFGSEIT